MNIANRSISSVSWNALANFIKLPIAIIQAIVLARLLPVEYFGIYAGMVALVNISSVVCDFGLLNAFIHRSPETEDENKAAAVLFTVWFILSTVWAISLLTIALVLFTDQRQLVLIVLTISTFVFRLGATPVAILRKRINHRRLAIFELTNAVLVALISIFTAVRYTSIWALLVSSIVTAVWFIMVLYVWRPIWKPHFTWSKSIIRYYFNFGSKSMVANFLGVSMDYIDDLWTNFYLGDIPLGYYSRAYKFATYPREIIALPINKVTMGLYSELKYDRKRLSQAFFRANALLIRTGFLFAGVLFISSPSLVLFLLGEKWLPMVNVFRLMLVFTLFDPIRLTIANVIEAVGKPEKVLVVTGFQVMILLIGLFTLGNSFGIEGVALTVDIMMLLGIIFLLYYVRNHVDFSIFKLFSVPVFALFSGILICGSINKYLGTQPSEWVTFTLISMLFVIIYGGIIYIFEGQSIFRQIREIFSWSSWEIQIRELIGF